MRLLFILALLVLSASQALAQGISEDEAADAIQDYLNAQFADIPTGEFTVTTSTGIDVENHTIGADQYAFLVKAKEAGLLNIDRVEPLQDNRVRVYLTPQAAGYAFSNGTPTAEVPIGRYKVEAIYENWYCEKGLTLAKAKFLVKWTPGMGEVLMDGAPPPVMKGIFLLSYNGLAEKAFVIKAKLGRAGQGIDARSVGDLLTKAGVPETVCLILEDHN